VINPGHFASLEVSHNDSSCKSLELNADSDEGDWFEPDVPIEMKL